MSFERVSTIMKMADEAGTSAYAFNCTDYQMIQSVVAAAEAERKPVICMLYPEHAQAKHWTTPAVFADTVKSLAAKASVPVGLHLDHCSDYDYIVGAMRDGFTSVMYDGSMLPVEENIQNTREVTRVARVLGVDVEAELGRVGFAATVSDQSDTDMYTKPEVAAAFCEQSGCSSVAVAFGSAHGFYKETPKLDIDRLKAINAATSVPLVLHGGSGIPDDQLEQAFKNGINKFNVGTEFFWLYYEIIKEYGASDAYKDIFDFADVVQQKLIAYLREKLQLCKMSV